MAYLLGWKDILRPIRDGYRHLFPSPDKGPTPEERERQRVVDRSKGFLYFDTFEQLEAWTEADTDPLQRANTPLSVRSVAEEEGLIKAHVLLCHDYAGNYHEYEGISSVGLDEDRYTCEYLQYVDTFIYFSHKLICVPPPTWTNSLHRNGVKALGTILIEPQTLASEKLLQHGNDGMSFTLATRLARIADHCGFDGWLVNIEKPFPAGTWSSHVLVAFLRQLKSDMGTEKQLIWYDALTTSDKISYQNALNVNNVLFAKACGSILTNYCWKESDAADSVREALENELPPQQIYFGVDVWAQNVTKFTHPRITYPEYGGGGTNTGVAVAKTAELGLSAGIFAPAWTFEHFPGHGRAVEQTLWEAVDLPVDAACPCGDSSKRHQANKVMPVVASAKSHNAGSETFFFTDFSRAVSAHGDQERRRLYDDHTMHFQLGSQSILPLKTGPSNRSVPIRHRIEDMNGESQLVIETFDLHHPVTGSAAVVTNDCWRVPLFKLNMPVDRSLRLRTSYRDLVKPCQDPCSFYLKISGKIHELTQAGHNQADQLLDVVISRDIAPSANSCIQEFGFQSRAFDVETSVRLVEVDYICLQPYLPHSSPGPSLGGWTQPHTILDIQKTSRGTGDASHTRVSWRHTSPDKPLHGVPYSVVTGAFAYFVISIDRVSIGRAYAAEHIIPSSFAAGLAGSKVLAEIKGIGFDGYELASANTTLLF